MGKSKTPGSVPNRPIYSRISYLYQAAAYMTTLSEQKGPCSTNQGSETPGKETIAPDGQALSRRFLTDLRATSLKSQIRLSPAVKRTICKFCDSLLVEGETSSTVVENKSKGGKKPWADVLVVKCHTCGGIKRFPVQAHRQKRRPLREKEREEKQEKEKQKQDTEVVMMSG
ncbi:hypothetical protein AAE478_008442 [Parahypoxylon ruwenzoriense]